MRPSKVPKRVENLRRKSEPSRRCSDIVANESSKACHHHAGRYDPDEEHEQGENAWVQVRFAMCRNHSLLEAACKMAPSAEPATGQCMLDSTTDLTWEAAWACRPVAAPSRSHRSQTSADLALI